MHLDTDIFRVRPGESVTLAARPTRVPDLYHSKHHYTTLLSDHVGALSALQQLQYAGNQYAVLLIFQAMDAAGKDGVIRQVMSGVNPQGCQVFSFQHPSAEALDHDFLWRATQCLPERGRIGIFNRSYYEEVLIVRVHPEILQAQRLPPLVNPGETLWQARFRAIRGLEDHLHHSGTRILKFFLHLSREEQRQRFLDRIDEPGRNWKFSPADIEERQYWPQYMLAYEDCLGATSTDQAPWYVVPADDKKNAQLIVSRVILDTFQALDMHYPQADAARRRELRSIRQQLVGEAPATAPSKA